MAARRTEPLSWPHDAAPRAERARAHATAVLSERIRQGDRDGVRSALAGWEAADILAMMTRLRFKRARRLIDWLPDEMQIAVLAELDPRMREVLLQDETHRWLRKMLRRLDRERALRLLASLPRDVAEGLIAEMPEPGRWREALSFLEESAGEVMHRRFVAVTPDRTIGAVIDEVAARSDWIDQLDAIYVVDEADRLLGYLRIRDLLVTDRATRVGEAMRADVVSVNADMDREAVLRLAERRHLRAVAVRDRAGRLVGCVRARELADIARAEAEEDMKIMSGLPPEATAHDPPLRIVRRRLPWLLGGLLGAGVAASVIGAFEASLARAAILASFIPVVMATAGNAGIQASTVTVQALTSGTLWPGELWPRLGRECLGAALNGLAVAAAVAAVVLLAALALPVDRAPALALTAGLALVAVTTIASLIGAAVPVALDRMGIDPAVSTGIFITTGNDVFGVLAFFLIASALYL
jgi:magnesium transporter